MPKGATGRPRGRPRGSKSRLTREHEAITAEALESLTEEQIQALKPIDVERNQFGAAQGGGEADQQQGAVAPAARCAIAGGEQLAQR